MSGDERTPWQTPALVILSDSATAANGFNSSPVEASAFPAGATS
ncbi:MAG: hypothetical protein U0R64_00610 [Candidatus Nanopelagicales bacterium]